MDTKQEGMTDKGYTEPVLEMQHYPLPDDTKVDIEESKPKTEGKSKNEELLSVLDFHLSEKHKRILQIGVAALLAIGYCIYFGFAMHQTFHNDPALLILTCMTIFLGCIYLIVKKYSEKIGKVIDNIDSERQRACNILGW